LFVIRTQNRIDLQDYLHQNGIQGYPLSSSASQSKGFVILNHLSFRLPKKIHDEVLSLPISPVLTMDEVTKSLKKLNES
jgi:dTDP-4-amino-4,6-dideoxygalactose transaminase